MSVHAIYNLSSVGGGFRLTATSQLAAPASTAWEPVIDGFSVLLGGSATGVTAVVEVSATDPANGAAPVQIDQFSGSAPLKQTYSWPGLVWARVRVTATSGAISIAISGRSTLQAVPRPKLLTAPVITGDATVGQTLTVGGYAWDNAPSSTAFQWYLDAAPIPGANSQSLLLSAAQLGGLPGCVVSAANDDGTVSAPMAVAGSLVKPVALAPLTVAGSQQVTASFSAGAAAGSAILAFDTVESGAVLTVKPNDGRVAPTATGLAVGLTSSSAGSRTTYRVTKSRPGNAPVSVDVAVTVSAGGGAGATLLTDGFGNSLIDGFNNQLMAGA